MLSKDIRSIYVHFPFCESKCHYCDFYSIGREKTTTDLRQSFIKSLRVEAELRAPWISNDIQTVFFGGGTPSMTSPEEMKWALKPIIDKQTTAPIEWTLEANPSSVTLESLTQYRELGVNRVSFGVQSLNSETLKKLGRVHSRDDVFQALRWVFEAGFKNVSVDLLCGVPNQTEEDLREAIQELIAFPITHLSCYLLTLPKHHKMAKDLPSENIQMEHYQYVVQFLESHGFEHYEVSNFSKRDFRCLHNSLCWKGESYVGLGPSAHSYDSRNKKRWKNGSSLHTYIKSLETGRIPTEGDEILTKDQMELEKWMLGLRLDLGVPKSWLDSRKRLSRFDLLLNKGLVESNPENSEHWRLTSKGFILLDQIVSYMI